MYPQKIDVLCEKPESQMKTKIFSQNQCRRKKESILFLSNQ